MAQVNKNIKTIEKRIAHLTARIESAEEQGRILSFDIRERTALTWALSVVREHLEQRV